MYQIARNFKLRLVLSFTICTSLLLLPGVSLLSEASQGQSPGAATNARPRHKKPEGILPDLEDVKNESHVEREAPLPIPSTLRTHKNPEKPWNGRRVGDPETRPPQSEQGAAGDKKIQRAHARKRMNAAPFTMYEDQFIQNFFSQALLRSATYEETLFWNYQLRAAYNQGQTSLKLAAVELGKTLFESASYAARTRNDHWYVYDLYKTFLMREPDAGGWAYWESVVPSNGRENVRRAFEEAPEFATLLSTIVLSGGAGSNPASLITARVDPRNQPGNGMLTRDVNWSVSLLSLPGRNGLDLGLALSYSSMVWTPSGPYFHFDEDNGFPSPGFRLGFPTVQRKVFDAQTAKNSFLLITPAGHRVELRQVGASNVYEAGDSSYLQLIDNSPNLLVRSADGTQLSFVEINNEFSCTEIKDRNGNYITVYHNALGHISSITDTLGRVINFNYDSNANLISITQAWNGQPAHQWVSFGWSTRNMQYSFATEKVIGTAAGALLPVITQVALNDTSSFTFDYTNSLQVSVIKKWFGPLERNTTSFVYETPSGDVSRLTSSSVSAMNWTGVNGLPAQVTTQYSVAADGACVLTAPDGTVYREYYGSGWQKGLTTLSEIWSGGVKQKWTTTAWTQDNTAVSYETNPRVVETNVYDAGGNRRRTTIDYGQYAQWGLPYWITEYAADGTTEIRRTFTDYNLSQAYLDRRIIGLVSAVHLTNVFSYQGKITYDYDDPARLAALPNAATVTQHDTSYNTSLTARGNLTSVTQWDFTDINNASKKLTSYTNYFVTGTPASATDPSTHTSSISYLDAFSDNVDRHTFAYPTTLTDADGNSSTVQYNFDFGATTRTQSPAPANQSQGAIQTMAYNNLGQLERITTVNNGAYKRFWYGPNYVASYATVNTVADELYSVQAFDGMGQVMGAVNNHPGSNGGYSLVSIIYDQMGRVWLQSNPTEINSAWQVFGDDAAGIYYTQQTYDWKGRPLVTTNQDGTTKTASYSGCGCAGGEVVTLTDEGTINGSMAKRRQQKIYSDVFGRTWKVELLNWDGTGPNGTAPGNTVYATTVNTYNVRDQVMQTRQYAGAEGSGTYQDTTMTYDGYGRLQSRHVPEQSAGLATVWEYNSDDTLHKTTDARGASATYVYNNGRHLVSQIQYYAPAGVAGTANVSLTYDAAGNRTSMSDGVGSQTYSYNSLSRLTSETRTIADPASPYLNASFILSYDYNLAGSLKSITDPWNVTINYGIDTAGRLANVTGVNYGVSSFINSTGYRAWGAPKQVAYGNGRTASMNYNSRMQTSHLEIPSVGGLQSVMSIDYQYHADGRLRYSHDILDPRFDRSYAYDHRTRIVTALSGAEARGEPATTDRPYYETFAYDAFDHFTSRDTESWSKTHGFYSTDTYANNRRNAWTYDANGNLTNNLKRQYSYNSAGQMITVSASGSSLSQLFDGNGNRIKTTEYGIATYYLRSTVLDEVVSELDSTGAKTRSFVYAGGKVLAESLLLVHEDVSGTSVHKTSAQTGYTVLFDELDPVGADAYTEDPYLEDPNFGGRGEGGPVYPAYGNISDPSRGCTTNGIYGACDWQPPQSFWGNDMANLPGFGTNWGSFSNLAEWEYGGYLGFRLEHSGIIRRREDSRRRTDTTPEPVSQKPPCTFNINLTNRSKVPISKRSLKVIEQRLKAIFGSGGYEVTLNNPSAATTPAFNYDLTVYNNFPSSYPNSARFDNTTVGYTRLTRQVPDSQYPDISFPGPTGGVSVNHIRDQYGANYVKPGPLADLVARIGAHEMIGHYLLMEPGHPDQYAEGVTAQAIGDPRRTDFVISAAVKEQLDKICSSRELPR